MLTPLLLLLYFVPKETKIVVTTLKTTPNPNTTPYPTCSDNGGMPPKNESCPSYRSNGGLVLSFFVFDNDVNNKEIDDDDNDGCVDVVVLVRMSDMIPY